MERPFKNANLLVELVRKQEQLAHHTEARDRYLERKERDNRQCVLVQSTSNGTLLQAGGVSPRTGALALKVAK